MPSSVVLATASYDNTIRFWEAPAGVCYRTIQHPEAQVNRMAISPDKSLLAAAGNPHIRLFDVVNVKSTNPITTYDGHKSNVTGVGFQRDGKWMYTGSEDATIKIWDLRAPGYSRDYQVPAPINSIALHPDQRHIFSVDQDARLQIWDLQSGRCLHETVVERDTAARAVTVSSTGEFCAVSTSKGNVHVFSLNLRVPSQAERTPHVFKSHDTYVLQTLFLATTSADHTIKLWSVKHGFALHKTFQGHQRWVWDCAFSADSAYLVTGSSDHSARLWDLSTGETLRTYAGHHKPISCVALNDCTT